MSLRTLITPFNPVPAQALVVTLSKHRYFLKGGGLRYSPAPLATDSKKQRLRIYMICDEQTDTFYAEIHPDADPVDVMGFLTRAWIEKPWHHLRGLPLRMSVPKALLATRVVRDDMRLICEHFRIEVFSPLFPPWYAHMIGRFERAMDDLSWRAQEAISLV